MNTTTPQFITLQDANGTFQTFQLVPVNTATITTIQSVPSAPSVKTTQRVSTVTNKPQRVSTAVHKPVTVPTPVATPTHTPKKSGRVPRGQKVFNNGVAYITMTDSKGVDRLLMVVNKKGQLNLPGGMKDKTDVDECHTALRETAEETTDHKNGAVVDISSATYCWTYANNHNNGSTTMVAGFHLGTSQRLHRHEIKNRETTEVTWMAVGQLRSIIANGGLNDTDDYTVLGKKYKMYGPCVGTFMKLSNDGFI